MCYSLESSRNAFVIGSLTSIYLILIPKDKMLNHIGLFLFAVNLIQLLEYFIWDDLECKKYNTIATNFLPIVLMLQLLALHLGGYYYKTFKINDNILLFFSVLIILGILISFFIRYEDDICTTTNEDNSLEWGFLHRVKDDYFSSTVYYGSFLFLPFFAKDIYKSMMVFVIGLTTWLYTSALRPSSSYTRWCYFSAFTPIAFVIMDIIKKYKIFF